jgi:hypothetical protein
MGTTQRTKYNGFMALPAAQRRIWGQELAPSRPQPPTGGTDGIQPATGGWLADDPRVVPLRPRACGVVVLGLVYRRREQETLPAAQYRVGPGLRAIARENGVAFNSPRGAVNQDVKNQPVCSKIVASLINICWLLHMRHRPLWV